VARAARHPVTFHTHGFLSSALSLDDKSRRLSLDHWVIRFRKEQGGSTSHVPSVLQDLALRLRRILPFFISFVFSEVLFFLSWRSAYVYVNLFLLIILVGFDNYPLFCWYKTRQKGISFCFFSNKRIYVPSQKKKVCHPLFLNK